MNFKTNQLKITQSKQHREDRFKKKKDHILRDLWDKKKRYKVMALEYLEEKELQDDKIFEKKLTKFSQIWQTVTTWI